MTRGDRNRLNLDRGIPFAEIEGMTVKVREIITEIEGLSAEDRQEVFRWLWQHAEETSEMLAAIDEGVRSLEEKPRTSAEEVQRKVRQWAVG